MKAPDYINSNIKADFFKLKSGDIPKLSVGCGIFLQSYFKKYGVRFNHKEFDLNIIDNKIVLEFNSEGKRNIRVNLKKYPDYLENTEKAFKEGLTDYLMKNY